jgi:hypothetical protein
MKLYRVYFLPAAAAASRLSHLSRYRRGCTPQQAGAGPAARAAPSHRPPTLFMRPQRSTMAVPSERSRLLRCSTHLAQEHALQFEQCPFNGGVRTVVGGGFRLSLSFAIIDRIEDEGR